MASTPEHPSVSAIEKTLHKTTEFLALAVSRPAATAPRWNDFEWRIAKATAALHGISGLLADALPWKGPDHWHEFLCEQRRHTALRQQHIRKLVAQIGIRTQQNKIALVPLKGAALVATGIYQPGQRPMADIDLLVQGGDTQAVIRLLTGLDYKESFTSWRHCTLEPATAAGPIIGFGEHVDNPVKIEIHTRIAERLPHRETDITTLIMPDRPTSGLNDYPSIAALTRHLLLHAAGNMRARALRFIQLHDIAMLARRMIRADWEELINGSEKATSTWWVLPPLLLTAQYFPTAIPASVLAAACDVCPWALRTMLSRRTLVEVSWSNIRIRAFPGIEWSRSFGEAVSFIASRIIPGPEARTELKYVTTALPWGSQIPWYGISHSRRIARWLVSAPPRTQTMFSVLAALQAD